MSQHRSSSSILQTDRHLTPETLLTADQVAEMLGLCSATLAGWRFRGFGPAHVRLSKRAVRYRLSEIEAWLSRNERSSTSDQGHAIADENLDRTNRGRRP